MLAKQAASLDVLSGGRFELGLGAGAFWDGIAAMGGPARTPREALQALEEAIHVIRAFWSGERTISFQGEHYHRPRPPPRSAARSRDRDLARRRQAARARAHRTPRRRLGPVSLWATPELVPDMQRRIDEAAASAGRDPAAVRRAYNVGGRIVDGPTQGLLHGPPEHWVETLAGFARDLGFDTFVFWPDEEPLGQLDRFAQEVIPGVRSALAR